MTPSTSGSRRSVSARSSRGSAATSFKRRAGTTAAKTAAGPRTIGFRDTPEHLSLGGRTVTPSALSTASGSSGDTLRSATPSSLAHAPRAATASPPLLLLLDGNMASPPRSCPSSRPQSRQAQPNRVIAPWGPERANLDQLPHELLRQRRVNYHRILDEQNALNAIHDRWQLEEESRLNKPEATSFASTHCWGIEASHPMQERAIFAELLETVAMRKQEEKEQREFEQMRQIAWAEQREEDIAAEWQAKREHRRVAGSQLAASWRSAVEEKRHRQTAERQATLKEEQEEVRRLVHGMVPPRRVRRDCPHPPLTAR